MSCYTANVTTRLPGRPAEDPLRPFRRPRDPRLPPARPHLVGRTGRQRPRRIDPAASRRSRPSRGRRRSTRRPTARGPRSPPTSTTAPVHASAPSATRSSTATSTRTSQPASGPSYRVHDAHEDGTGATPDGQLVNPLLALRDIGAESVPVAASVPPVEEPPFVRHARLPAVHPGRVRLARPAARSTAHGNASTTRPPSSPSSKNGVPVDAPAMRIVDGKALDPALLEATQDISTTATDGSFTLSFGGETTEPIALPSTADAIKTALEALDEHRRRDRHGCGHRRRPWKVQLVLWRSTPDLSITATYIPAEVRTRPSPRRRPPLQHPRSRRSRSIRSSPSSRSPSVVQRPRRSRPRRRPRPSSRARGTQHGHRRHRQRNRRHARPVPSRAGHRRRHALDDHRDECRTSHR